MKYFITLIFAAAVIFYSCGDDNTTNNSGTGGETVIFSMDSMSIYLSSSIESIDTNINILNSNNIKINFDCITNSDSINSFSSFKISAIDSNNIYLDSINNHISKLNNNHNIYINASSNFIVNILIQISRTNQNIYFIKLKNVKIFRV